jgi:hypothetical protein
LASNSIAISNNSKEEFHMDLNSDLNSVSTPKHRGGARIGAGRPRKSKPDLIPSKEDQIAQIQKLLAANPPAREAVVLTRQLGQLTGALKTYARNKADQQPSPEPYKPQPAQPLWVLRGDLVERVADRLQNASELVLTGDDIEAGAALGFTSEQLRVSVRDWIWDHAHLDIVRSLLVLAADADVDKELLQLASNPNQPGSWIAYLKVHPDVYVNAGPVLSPDELRDVEQYRAKVQAAKDQARRDIYEKYPDRFLHGYKTVAEYDAHYPGEASILKHDWRCVLSNWISPGVSRAIYTLQFFDSLQAHKAAAQSQPEVQQ